MPKIDVSEEVLNKVAGEEMKKLRTENAKLRAEVARLKDKISQDKSMVESSKRLYQYLKDTIAEASTEFDFVNYY